MMRGKPAVFDETLVPDSTLKLLQSRGVDSHELRTNHVRRRLEQGFDPTLVCLGLILDCVLTATLRMLDERTATPQPRASVARIGLRRANQRERTRYAAQAKPRTD